MHHTIWQLVVMSLTVTGGGQRQQPSDEARDLCLRRDMSQRALLSSIKCHIETATLTERFRVLCEHREDKYSETVSLPSLWLRGDIHGKARSTWCSYVRSSDLQNSWKCLGSHVQSVIPAHGMLRKNTFWTNCVDRLVGSVNSELKKGILPEYMPGEWFLEVCVLGYGYETLCFIEVVTQSYQIYPLCARTVLIHQFQPSDQSWPAASFSKRSLSDCQHVFSLLSKWNCCFPFKREELSSCHWLWPHNIKNICYII